MNIKGNIKIPLMLIVAIVIVIIIAVVILCLGLANINEKNKTASNQEQISNIIDELTNNKVEENYDKYDEKIANVALPKIEINTIAEENSTINGNVPTFYNPVIPKGFKAITYNEDNTIDQNAKWGEGNSYLYGLVIEDSNKNQFVWVPVENMELFKTTDWQKNEPKETIDPTYIEPTNDEKDDYYKMYYKVKKYGGFYVGRYETGDIDSTNNRTEIKNSDNIGVRKNLIAYNYVPFQLSTINKREITGAKELVKKFEKNNSYSGVTASVMYGVQWDSMLRFIKNEKNNVNDSITWGNYPKTILEFTDIYGNSYQKTSEDVYLLRTGSSEQTKTKNIYDIAGNLAEWTMETTKDKVNIARGGSYVSTIGQLAATRYAYQNNTANNSIGFRISLYIN